MVTFPHGASGAPDIPTRHYTDSHARPAAQRPGGAQ